MRAYRVFRPTAVLASSIALLLATAVHAQTINLCQAKKKLCVSKKTLALLRCHEAAERHNSAVDPTCTQKARDKFDGGADPSHGCFGKLEAGGGCLTTNDTAALETDVDNFIDDVISTIDPGYPVPVQNLCSVRKKKCVAKKVKALLECHYRAEKSGTLDAGCVQKAKDRFDGGADPTRGCFAKLEAAGGCLTMNDTSVVETKVDGFVRDVDCALDPASPECAAPTPTFTPTPFPTPTTTPGGSCPSAYRLTMSGAASDVDLGWTGLAHDNEMTSNARLTFAVTSCANALTPCGQCSLSGPFENAGGATFQNHRCRGDDMGANGSWITCASDAECPGTGNACIFYVGPPQPLNAGFALCALYEVAAPVTGTIDSDTGDLSLAMTIGFAAFLAANGFDHPCPSCVAGACMGGERNGQPCTVQGTSAAYGDDVSLDCPPSALSTLDSSLPLPLALTLTTGTQSLTLEATSPNCSAQGFTGMKCQCDTCNNAAATLCHTDADCAAVGATTCGGRRCVGGTNNGTPCTANSECPGGVCARLGAATAPNQCDDAVCSANPSDTGSTDEGVCMAGPFDSYCAIQRFHPCVSDTDCTTAGDYCSGHFRECFTDNGVAGNSIIASGSAADAPTVAGLTCMGPTTSGYYNSLIGLPGPARFTMRAQGILN